MRTVAVKWIYVVKQFERGIVERFGKNPKWRETLGVEAEFGRMVVSNEKLKYIR